MPKKQKEKSQAHIYIISTILIVALISLALYFIFVAEYAKLPNAEIYVSEVIDGDTFKLNNGETIRLLCVDTPEKGEAKYEEAKLFLESIALLKEPRFEFGISELDKYNRTLAFVYVNISNEEIFINKEIIRLGFGELFEYGEEDCAIVK